MFTDTCIVLFIGKDRENKCTGGKPRNNHKIVLMNFVPKPHQGHVVVVSRPKIG